MIHKGLFGKYYKFSEMDMWNINYKKLSSTYHFLTIFVTLYELYTYIKMKKSDELYMNKNILMKINPTS